MPIRLWKLGSLEQKIIPTQKAVAKLADMLKNAGEDLDIIWGPDIEVQEIEAKEGERIENYTILEVDYPDENTVILKIEKVDTCQEQSSQE